MLVGEILRLAGQRVGMTIGAAIIMIFGPNDSRLIQTSQDHASATSVPWDSFRGLYYLTAASLMFASLILKCTGRREGPSHLIAGVAYTCAAIGILIDIYNQLPLEYISTGVTTIIFLVIFSLLYGYLTDRADQMPMEP